MAAGAYAASATLFGSELPKVRNAPQIQSRFGDIAIVAFLLAQCFDGVLTYLGVVVLGIAAEGNPLIATLMASVGNGTALLGAKVIAASLGIWLHILEVHGVVAILTAFYVTAAVAPWTLILFS